MNKITFGMVMIAASTCFGEVIFEDAFENGVGNWKAQTSASTFELKPGFGTGGSTALVWKCTEPKHGWEFYTVDFKGKPGHEYSFTMKAQSTEDVIGRVYARLVSKSADGKKVHFRLDGRPIINNGWKANHKGWWTDFSNQTPPLPPGGENCSFEIAVRLDTTGSVSFDDLKIYEGEKVVVKWTESSAYRNTLDKGRVKFACYYTLDPAECPLESRKAGFEMQGADGKRFTLKAEELTDTYFTAAIDVSELAMGEQMVKSVIGDSRTKSVIAADAIRFTRVEKLPGWKVWFDEHQRLIVDGKPFFPIGCYGCGRDEAETKLYAEAGFNCTITGGENARRALRHGLKVIVGCCGSKTNIYDRAFKEFGDNAGVIAWYTADELPLGFQRSEVKLHRYLHALDPQRPTLTVLDRPLQTRDHLASFDVIGTDPYPVCNYPGCKISIAATYPETVREATFGMRPIWQVPQAFDWYWHRRNFRGEMAVHRFPNREEFIAMSYQPLACGVLGLLWYDFDWFVRDIPKEEYEATWAYFRGMVQNIAANAEVFLSVEPVPELKFSEPKVRAKSWKKGNDHYLLVCNIESEPVKVRIEPGFTGKMTAIEGSLPTHPTGRAYDFDLKPLEVSFIRFSR